MKEGTNRKAVMTLQTLAPAPTVETSFNGAVNSLRTILQVSGTSIPALLTPLFNATPHVTLLNIYNPKKGLIYLPSEWVSYQPSLYALLRAAAIMDAQLHRSALFLTVESAERTAQLPPGSHLTVVNSRHESWSFEAVELHETHNVTLSWYELGQEPSTDTINKMM